MPLHPSPLEGSVNKSLISKNKNIVETPSPLEGEGWGEGLYINRKLPPLKESGFADGCSETKCLL